MPIVLKKGKQKIEYINAACGFDIETSSFYRDPISGEVLENVDSLDKKEAKRFEKCACMYSWCFGLNGVCVWGRDWKSFISCLQRLKEAYHLEPGKRHLVCYIHNLAFEMQFFRCWMEWASVFAVRERTPLKALCEYGIEFRCSLLLSGYTLQKTCEHLRKYKIEKMVGDLDYRKIRHSKTLITEEEKKYILNDVLGVMAYIQEEIEKCGSITRLPLTKTGFVREFVRNRCYWDSNSHKRDNNNKFTNYRSLMRALTLEVDEYLLLKQAFHGGMVHANCYNANKKLDNVSSYDFTSSYPAVMVMEKFPMSKGKEVYPKSEDQFKKWLRCYCCVMDITFHDLDTILRADHPLSASKCTELSGYEEDNGRLIRAETARVCLTDIDFQVYEKFYSWESITINKMYIYRRGYLPRDFVLAVLELYKNKTELKGVEGKENEYLYAKELLNSCFGMCVTDICREINTYIDGAWIKEAPDITKAIEEYNNKATRFLSYPWGVFITSYALRNLASGIIACSKHKGKYSGDYCYCDTDSVKILHHERYKWYFDAYNKQVEEKLKAACTWQGIPFEMCAPKTIEGKTKMLGVWDYEGTYKHAKFLGAKRYAVEEGNGKHSITIAGVNKKAAIPALEKKSRGGDFFDFIKFGYTFEKDECGKLLHTYLDSPRKGLLCDYRGVLGRFEERSMVHLEPTTYVLDANETYLELLDSVLGIEVFEERMFG